MLRERLAQAESKLAFAETKLANLIVTAEEIIDSVAGQVDIKDGSYEDGPSPNDAMRLTMTLEEAIGLAKMPWNISRFHKENPIDLGQACPNCGTSDCACHALDRGQP